MTINVTGRGTTVRDSFKDTLEKKLSKFERFFEDDARADVTVTREGGRETVEITIHSDGMVFRSERTTDERHESLDLVADTLFRQITKNKSKLKTKLRKNAFDAFEAFDMNVANSLNEESEDDMDDQEEYKIVRSKRFPLKPMLIDEAILQMNLLGHSFFMFLEGNSGQTAVVYRRNDGNYGLIEPASK